MRFLFPRGLEKSIEEYLILVYYHGMLSYELKNSLNSTNAIRNVKPVKPVCNDHLYNKIYNL